jgi:predicted esterase
MPSSRPTEHLLTVRRTARYFTLGPTDRPVRQLWLVLHGHAQLAQRFLHAFDSIDDGTRLIVAPEALSRFYLDTTTEGRHGQRVGATWMTKEMRESEIADYVGYLDAVISAVEKNQPASPDLRVLGFSQGAATAARWALSSQRRPRRLVLWGGAFPLEALQAATAERLAGVDISFVRGAEDGYLPTALLDPQVAALQARGIAARLLSFAGGHELHGETLRRLAD